MMMMKSKQKTQMFESAAHAAEYAGDDTAIVNTAQIRTAAMEHVSRQPAQKEQIAGMVLLSAWQSGEKRGLTGKHERAHAADTADGQRHRSSRYPLKGILRISLGSCPRLPAKLTSKSSLHVKSALPAKIFSTPARQARRLPTRRLQRRFATLCKDAVD